MSDAKVKCLDCARLHNGYCPVRAMIVAAQSERVCRFYEKQRPKGEGSDVHEE